MEGRVSLQSCPDMAKLMTLMPGIYGVGQLLVKHWIDESGKYPSEHSGESDQQDSLLSQRRARRVILHAWPKTRFPNIRSGLLLFHPCFPRPPSRAVRLQITKHTHPISLFDVFFSLSIQCCPKRRRLEPSFVGISPRLIYSGTCFR